MCSASYFDSAKLNEMLSIALPQQKKIIYVATINCRNKHHDRNVYDSNIFIYCLFGGIKTSLTICIFSKALQAQAAWKRQPTTPGNQGGRRSTHPAGARR